MSNPANNGTITGRLARDVMTFDNKDGSKKVVFTVMVDRNYKNGQGEITSDAIPVEAFVRKDTDFSKTPFAMIHRGDLVLLHISLRPNNYTNRADEQVYDLTVNVEGIKLLDSKRVTQARLAERLAAAEHTNQQLQAQGSAAVPAQAAPQSAMHDQMPFGS